MERTFEALTLLYADVFYLRDLHFLKHLIWAIEANYCFVFWQLQHLQKPTNKPISNCMHVQMKPEGSYHPCLPASVAQDHHNLTGTSHFRRLKLLCRCFDIMVSSRCQSSTHHLALNLATVVLCCVLHREHILNIRNEYIKEAHHLHHVSLIYSLTFFCSRSSPYHKGKQCEQAGSFKTGQVLHSEIQPLLQTWSKFSPRL